MSPPLETAHLGCAFAGCGNRATRKGLCNPHYEQQRLGKELRPLRARRSESADLAWMAGHYESKARWRGECLELPVGRARYPQTTYQGRVQAVGRVILEHYRGPARGRMMLHSCDNPACIRASHLRWGSGKENARDRQIRDRYGPRAKMKVLDVRGAKLLLAAGIPKKEVAASLGVVYEAIRGIAVGRIWRYV